MEFKASIIYSFRNEEDVLTELISRTKKSLDEVNCTEYEIISLS